MSDIRFNQWLHNSGTGGVSQVDGGHVGIGTTNPEIAVHSGNNKILNVGIVTASTYYGDGSNLTSLPAQATIANNADNRVITGGSGVNLNGESTLTYDGTYLDIGGGVTRFTKQGSYNSLEIGFGQNSNQNAFIDLIGDTTYTDYGTRIIRNGQSGANAQTDILHRGTGSLNLQTSDAAPIVIKTNGNNDRLVINADGKIGVSRVATQHPLEIGHASEPTLSLWRGSTKSAALQAQSGGTYLMSYENSPLIFSVASGSGYTERLRILSNGAITCGHGANFNLHGSSTTGICLNGNGNSGQIIANADGNRALIIGRQSSFGQVIEFFQGSGGSNTNMAGITIPAADTLGLETNGTERFRIESDGDLRLSGNNSATNYGWIRGWQSSTGDMIIGADQSATGTGTSRSNLIFRTRGSERARIQAGGLKLNGGSYIMEVSAGHGAPNNNNKQMDQRRWMWYGSSSSTHTVARVAKASSGQPGDGDSSLAAWIVTYTARSMYGFNSDGGYSVMKMRTGRFDYNDNEVRFSTEQDTLGTGSGSQNPTIVFTDEGSGVVRISITNPSSTHSFGEINLMTYDCRITLPSG